MQLLLRILLPALYLTGWVNTLQGQAGSTDSLQPEHPALYRIREIYDKSELDRAVDEATRSSRFLAIMLYTPGCDQCPELENNLARESALYEYKEFIPLKINARTVFGDLIATRHNVTVFPSVVIASGQGNYVTHESDFPDNDVYYLLDEYVNRYILFFEEREKFRQDLLSTGELNEYVQLAAELGQLIEVALAVERLDSIFLKQPELLEQKQFTDILVYLPGTKSSSLYKAFSNKSLNRLSDAELGAVADRIYEEVLLYAIADTNPEPVEHMITEILELDPRFNRTRPWTREEYLSKVNSFWKSYYIGTGNVLEYRKVMKDEITSGRSTPFIEGREILDQTMDAGFIQLAILELKEDLQNGSPSAHYSYISYGYLKLNNPEEAEKYYNLAVESLSGHDYPRSLVDLLAPYFSEQE